MGREKTCNSRGKCHRCRKCCSSFASLAFSTLGLIIAVATYSVMGALLFQRIEETPEKEKLKNTREAVINASKDHIEELVREAQKHMTLNWTVTLIEDSEDAIFNVTGNRNRREADANSTSSDVGNNNITGSVFNNSSNNVSTPTLEITTTGSVEVNIVSNCTSNKSQQRTNMTMQSINETRLREELTKLVVKYRQQIFEKTRIHHWDGITDKDTVEGKWTFAAALLYAITAITTIGYGHVTPATTAGQLVTIFYCLIGLPLTLMCIAKVGHAFATAFRVIYHTCCCAMCCLACIMRRHKEKMKTKDSGSDLNDALGALVVGQNDRNSSLHRIDEYTPWKEWRQSIQTNFNRSLQRDTAVPTSMCLLVMTAYIIGGAAMFTSYEEEWDLAQSAYFCFVTLTTIGFGDYVPGFDSNKKGRGYVAVTDFVLCALYLLVGLSLIGMCIDLMQVDVGKKFRWVGRKVGLTRSKNARTPSDTKKEKVGLKLSCEAIPEIMSNNHMPVSRSVSHSLEVPSPSSVYSPNSKRSSSMPNTPSIPNKFFSPPPLDSR